MGEWLEVDGLGGFAMGNASLIPTRRYHTAYTFATTAPVHRIALVHMPEVSVETSRGRFPLSSFSYQGDVVFPQGNEFLLSFSPCPWPTWKFLIDGITIFFELFIPYKHQCVVMSWHSPQPCGAKLVVRPFFSGRNFHSLCSATDSFPLATSFGNFGVTTNITNAGIKITSRTNGTFIASPQWNFNFQYTEERERGYDYIESLPSPGYFNFELSEHPATIIMGPSSIVDTLSQAQDTSVLVTELMTNERTRRKNKNRYTAETYLVSRGEGKSIIAGYPWFADWGRDTAIACRGLLIAQGFLEDASSVLLTWAKHLHRGLIPNRFLEDDVSTPEYNSVDASLWWIIAAYELLTHQALESSVSEDRQQQIRAVIDSIITHYFNGTDLGITMDRDGLLRCGQQGTQLTWMDAKIGDYVVTPRRGKPVEIQALWINALLIAEKLSLNSMSQLSTHRAAAQQSFNNKFWLSDEHYLADVIEADGVIDAKEIYLRPNQLFATGGLPFALVSKEHAQQVVTTIKHHLLTPGGIRTLSPQCRGYIGQYQGDQPRRDLAYHQGTAWSWLIGAYVDSCIYAYGEDSTHLRKITCEVIEPLIKHLGISVPDPAVPEIADGDSPFSPRGATHQAWSSGELIRACKRLQYAQK